MFERGPSIQNASVLQIRNGSSPISGSARLIALIERSRARL